MQRQYDVEPQGTHGCFKKPGYAECPGTNRFQFELAGGDPGLGAVTIDNTTVILIMIIVGAYYWFAGTRRKA